VFGKYMKITFAFCKLHVMQKRQASLEDDSASWIMVAKVGPPVRRPPTRVRTPGSTGVAPE